MASLDELVAQYGEHDAQEKAIKKVCDSEKKELKELLSADGLSDYIAGGYTVKYSVSERTTLDEERMLTILKRDWAERFGSMACPYIRTREYVDMDALEAVLYAGELPSEVLADLDKCREVTEVVTLKCAKEKKKKED